MSTTLKQPRKDKFVDMYEMAVAADEAAADELDVTQALRSIGSILDPVSADQRTQLDMFAAMRSTRKKLSRRAKKSARRGK